MERRCPRRRPGAYPTPFLPGFPLPSKGRPEPRQPDQLVRRERRALGGGLTDPDAVSRCGVRWSCRLRPYHYWVGGRKANGAVCRSHSSSAESGGGKPDQTAGRAAHELERTSRMALSNTLLSVREPPGRSTGVRSRPRWVGRTSCRRPVSSGCTPRARGGPVNDNGTTAAVPRMIRSDSSPATPGGVSTPPFLLHRLIQFRLKPESTACGRTS